MTDEKNVEFKKPKQTPDAKKSKKGFGWWAGVVVLILISITFILPATGIGALFAQDGLVFGSYNNEKILYQPGNYFGRQVSRIAQSSNASDINSIMQAWAQGYQLTVLRTALNQAAAKAGYKVTDSQVNQYILDAGVYNNEEGAFDKSIYDSVSKAEKDLIVNDVRFELPSSVVLNDVSTVLTSNAERKFVASMGATGRSFEYVAFSSEVYPDAEAIEYLEENPQPFKQLDLSIITLQTQAEAQSLSDELNANTKSFEEALELSIDSFKSENGKLGPTYYNDIVTLAGEEVASTLFSSSVGTYSSPIYTNSGYSILRVDAEATAAVADESTLLYVKNYILNENSEAVLPYIEAASNDFYNNESILETERPVYTVAASALNPANSSLISSIQYYDSMGLLYSASSDSAYLDALYSSEVGTVLPPQKVGNSYIITRVVNDEYNAQMESSISTYYDLFMPSILQGEMQNNILTNPSFKDDFYSVFLSKVLSSNV